MSELNPKQLRFVQEYLIDLNAKQAAIRAGYAPKAAQEQGSRLLSHAKVASEIAKRQAKVAEKAEITAEFVLAGIVALIKRCEQNQEESTALKGYELLGKHLGMFKERVEHTGKGGGPIETVDVSDRDIAQRAAFLLQRGLEAKPH